MALTPVPFRGESMRPLLKETESVLVDFFSEPRRPGDLKPGDVVLYKEDYEWVCHRYLGKFDGAFLFKGDFNTTLENRGDVAVWGVVKGFVRGETVYGIEKAFAAGLLCTVQRRQCQAKSWFAKKTYRAASFGILFLNNLFSIRKYNHPKS